MDTRRAHDDSYDALASPERMASDGRVTGRRLQLLEQAARRATRPAPDLTWERWGREVPKPTISIDAAAVRLAALHSD